jgi:hypothetical protein
MKEMEPAGADAAIHRLRSQAELQQLGSRDDTVLSGRERREVKVRVELTSHIDVKSTRTEIRPL